MPKRTVVLSDVHAGSVVGLWPDGVKLEGGGYYEPNKFQRWLLECWYQMLAQLEELVPFTAVLNGDAIQGVHPKDGELITSNLNIQVNAAHVLLEPFFSLAEHGYLVRGTEWHDGKAAEALELLGSRLPVRSNPNTGQFSWWEVFGNSCDSEMALIHFAHHINMSSVPWYEGTIPTRDMLLMFSELARFQSDLAPFLRMIVRSHRHRAVTVDLPPNMHAVVTPAWQLKTAFAHKKAASMLPQIGYTIIDNEGSDFMIRHRIFKLPSQHVEDL